MKIGIVGYGNLGRGVECAVKENPDMELVAVFTRRDPSKVKIQTPNVPVLNIADAKDWVGKIDVMILCGGSATDLPTQTPEFAEMFNVIDSFDTHAKIPEHFAKVDAAVGIRDFSASRAPTPMRFSPTAKIILSGAKASVKVIQMQFAASRASRMLNSTPCRLIPHLKLSVAGRIPNSRRVKNICANAL